MLADRSRPADGSPARPLAREQVAAMLGGIRDGAALHTVGELDEMAADSEQITHEESELLQAESFAARARDEDLAAGLRHRRLEGETSSASYLRDVSDRPRLPGGLSDGSSTPPRRATVAPGRRWWRRSCR